MIFCSYVNLSEGSHPNLCPNSSAKRQNGWVFVYTTLCLSVQSYIGLKWQVEWSVFWTLLRHKTPKTQRHTTWYAPRYVSTDWQKQGMSKYPIRSPRPLRSHRSVEIKGISDMKSLDPDYFSDFNFNPIPPIPMPRLQTLNWQKWKTKFFFCRRTRQFLTN